MENSIKHLSSKAKEALLKLGSSEEDRKKGEKITLPHVLAGNQLHLIKPKMLLMTMGQMMEEDEVEAKK